MFKKIINAIREQELTDVCSNPFAKPDIGHKVPDKIGAGIQQGIQPQNKIHTTVSTAGTYHTQSAGKWSILGAQNTLSSGLWSSIGTGSCSPSYIISLSTSAGKDVVKMNSDGSITWANDVDVDEAAKAFARSLQLGAEQKAGIDKRVKLQMRDSIFNDLIDIAKKKGSLSADDLTYLLESSKIVEKLKGAE